MTDQGVQVDEATARAAIEEHFATAGTDEEAACRLYAEDAVVEWPQSHERLRGRETIRRFREAYPARLEFEIRRLTGHGPLWVTEYTIFYDGEPTDAVNVVEFGEYGLVTRERIYFVERFPPPEWRSSWVEIMTDEKAPTTPPSRRSPG